MTVPCVKVKPGCEFDRIAPGGFVILAAIQGTVFAQGHDLVITAGTNDHVLPDPHSRGEAFDVSILGLEPVQLDAILRMLRAQLPLSEFTVIYEVKHQSDFVIPLPPNVLGSVNPDATASHIHIQVRKNTVYPPMPGVAAI